VHSHNLTAGKGTLFLHNKVIGDNKCLHSYI